MKFLALPLCLALASVPAAHASAQSASVHDAAAASRLPPVDGDRMADPAGEPAQADPDSPRRSRMDQTAAEERPVFRFSAMYRVVDRDEASKDNCLKNTGSRVRRESGCVAGNGQVFVPER
ncbi:hypothetical protein [Pseudoxanthomonas suwonensis]|uniref:hypothetical protein n=1 Tax=Pseudoxanthomonas suwonensis TaxID=314722 RepID=UPI000B1A29A5|nr:hypothetical protein [Pseudoxanthomonas suwonensis]